MKRKLLMAFLGLIVLSGVLTIVGWILPREHVASTRAFYHQSPEAIWDAVYDVEASTAWRSNVHKIDRLDDRNGLPVWVETGGDGRMMLEVAELAPPHRMVTRIADADLPFGGSWTYEIEPRADGATLTLTEDGEIYNPIYRFMARFFFGYHSSMEGYLTDLGTKFGEQIVPERLQ